MLCHREGRVFFRRTRGRYPTAYGQWCRPRTREEKMKNWPRFLRAGTQIAKLANRNVGMSEWQIATSECGVLLEPRVARHMCVLHVGARRVRAAALFCPVLSHISHRLLLYLRDSPYAVRSLSHARENLHTL